MGEGFGQWFFFMYLCIQEKRAASLSIVRQNGSHKSVKKLLHFCYTTTWTNQLGSCYTTKYERVVHFPLSPQIAVVQQVTAIFFDYDRDSIYCFDTLLWNPGSLLRSSACNQVGYTCRKNRFSTNSVLGAEKNHCLLFFSFLIYTFVGVHFNGHKESMLFASACRGDVGTLPNYKYH